MGRGAEGRIAAVPVARESRLTPQEHIADLITQIKESADKLATDRTSRGDLKILNRTLKELRYAFKVFSPYRNCRKVTMFGSARTHPADPCYQQAVRFGQAMAEQGWLVVTGAASGIMVASTRWGSISCSPSSNCRIP
jgi:hypothetical protein